jgi:hypothetical protein
MRRSKRQTSSETCDVSGCDNESQRSLSKKKVESGTDLNLAGNGKRVGLCKEHYRKYKKETKENRKLDSLGR